ncbi:MAG: T9SS type A sorting domain-containing protein [Candidatus Kapaibacterium sp.]|jgi:hypothetical protein
MKLFVSFMVALVFGLSASAQSLEVIATKKTYVIEKADSTWHHFYLGARNISGKTVPVRVRVDKSRLSETHRVKFCFAMECYDESTIESSAGGGVSTLGPGEADTSTFFGEFRADGLLGNSVATFTFFSNTNRDDNAQVELAFKVGEATTVGSESDSPFGLCSPNPASNSVTVAVAPGTTKEWTVEIMDIHGRVRSANVRDADSVTLSVADLATGTYTVLIKSGDERHASRLVVVH